MRIYTERLTFDRFELRNYFRQRDLTKGLRKKLYISEGVIKQQGVFLRG